jgi:hypothetical protein
LRSLTHVREELALGSACVHRPVACGRHVRVERPQFRRPRFDSGFEAPLVQQQHGVAVLNLLQHPVEPGDEDANLVGAVAGAALRADVVPALAGDDACDLRQPQQRRRDEALQPGSDDERQPERGEQHDDHDLPEAVGTGRDVTEIGLDDHRADHFIAEEDRPCHDQAVQREGAPRLAGLRRIGRKLRRVGDIARSSAIESRKRPTGIRHDHRRHDVLVAAKAFEYLRGCLGIGKRDRRCTVPPHDVAEHAHVGDQTLTRARDVVRHEHDADEQERRGRRRDADRRQLAGERQIREPRLDVLHRFADPDERRATSAIAPATPSCPPRFHSRTTSFRGRRAEIQLGRCHCRQQEGLHALSPVRTRSTRKRRLRGGRVVCGCCKQEPYPPT